MFVMGSVKRTLITLGFWYYIEGYRCNRIDAIGSALACLIFPRTPRTATSTLLMISKLILVLMFFITWLYFSLVLAEIFSATLFRKRIASGTVPSPQYIVVKTRGEIEPFSTCRTLLSYCLLPYTTIDYIHNLHSPQS